jgi:outer membrane murein-binding lipoprotein Lpp
VGRLRSLLTGTAIVVAGVLAAGCGSSPDPPTVSIDLPAPAATSGSAASDAQTETAGVNAGASEVDAAASAEPPQPKPSLRLDVPKDSYAVIWVRRGHRVEIRTEPGGGELVTRAGKRTEFGSPTVFGVVKQSGRWAGVSTPLLANGQLGWVRLDPKRLKAGWTRTSIVVDLSDRNAELLEGDKVKRDFAVTVGAPGTDTPLGRFAITDTFRGNLNPAYGCCALALSATQPSLPSGWLGGRRIAIHGTTGPLGIAASHGCVRAADADVSALVDRVPLGTPVFIRS